MLNVGAGEAFHYNTHYTALDETQLNSKHRKWKKKKLIKKEKKGGY